MSREGFTHFSFAACYWHLTPHLRIEGLSVCWGYELSATCAITSGSMANPTDQPHPAFAEFADYLNHAFIFTDAAGTKCSYVEPLVIANIMGQFEQAMARYGAASFLAGYSVGRLEQGSHGPAGHVAQPSTGRDASSQP